MRIGNQGSAFWGVFLALVLVGSPAFGQGAGGESNKTLRATIQKWVGVMKETQNAQERWKQDKQVLEDSRDSLTVEIEQLKSEIAGAEERIATTDAGSADKLAKKRMYEDAREAFRVGLDQVEKEVSAVIPLLPKELAELTKVEVAIQDHQRFAESTEKGSLSLNKRLDTMLTILAEAEKFNQAVRTFSGRSMAINGEHRLLDVVYFGLSLGYAVDRDGTMAFQLRPTELGWTDRRLEGKEVTKAVRQLVDVAQRSGEMQLVTVPMTVGK